jgi:hypothetical protein
LTSCLIEKAQNLSTSLLATGFFVIHDTSRSSKNQETELTGRQEVVDPSFDILLLDVEARRNNSSLIDTTNQLHNNLSGAVIINNFKFANVA